MRHLDGQSAKNELSGMRRYQKGKRVYVASTMMAGNFNRVQREDDGTIDGNDRPTDKKMARPSKRLAVPFSPSLFQRDNAVQTIRYAARHAGFAAPRQNLYLILKPNWRGRRNVPPTVWL